MPSFLSRLLSDERAVTAIEYSLVAAMISVAAVVAMTDVGQKLLNLLNQVAVDFPS